MNPSIEFIGNLHTHTKKKQVLVGSGADNDSNRTVGDGNCFAAPHLSPRILGIDRS